VTSHAPGAGGHAIRRAVTSRAYAMPAAALAKDSPDPPIALDDLPAAITTIIKQMASRKPPNR
jgi:hypothetical protein